MKIGGTGGGEIGFVESDRHFVLYFSCRSPGRAWSALVQCRRCEGVWDRSTARCGYCGTRCEVMPGEEFYVTMSVSQYEMR